jgi:hypothetical protein
MQECPLRTVAVVSLDAALQLPLLVGTDAAAAGSLDGEDNVGSRLTFGPTVHPAG